MQKAELQASEKLVKGLKDLGQVAFSLTFKKERSGAMKKTESPKRKETFEVDRREFIRLAAMFGTTATLGGILAAPSFATARELRELIVAQAAKGKEKVAAAAQKMILSIDGVSNRWPEGPIYMEKGRFFLNELTDTFGVQAVPPNRPLGLPPMSLHPETVPPPHPDIPSSPPLS
jgi:hypothetical protein